MTVVPDTVQVAVRIRPLNELELNSGCQCMVEQPGEPGDQRIVVRGSESFTFSHVFGPSAVQSDIYESCVREIIVKLLEGFNVTILAYGQTGSGKTYTMGTSFEGAMTRESGILPRALLDIFDMIGSQSAAETEDATSCHAFCSFIELYQENLYDLLSFRNRYERVVGIRENANGVVIPGLTELVVNSAEETLRWLMHGASARVIAPTAMNRESSRSHTIFTLTLRKLRHDGTTKLGTMAKLHFVDLAGSERVKKTHAVGDRLRESIQINKGLLALGNVISMLATSNQRSPKPFISFRDSKLTRLLQSALGGNSITLMIACVSPADYNLDETLSTLRYAERALHIKNKPMLAVSVSDSSAEIERLNKTVAELRDEIGLLRRRISSLSELPMLEPPGVGRQLMADNRSLQQKLETTIQEATKHELRASIAENALALLEPVLVQQYSRSAEELRVKCDEILLRYRNELALLQPSNGTDVGEQQQLQMVATG